MMELDDMRAKWAEHDHKLDSILRLNQRLMNVAQMSRPKSAMQRLAAGLALDAAINLAAVLMLGSFLYDQRSVPQFWLPAAALFLFAIAVTAVSLRQCVDALRVDYAAPIVAIQEHIGALRVLRIRSTQWILLTAPLVWTPLLIVASKGIFRMDAYKALGAPYLLANLLFGAAFIPLALWLARKWAGRIGGSRTLQWLIRSLAGYNLSVATDDLETLARFHDEKGGN